MKLPARLLALALAAASCGNVAAADPLTVFGAASLTEALEEIGASYGEKTGTEVRFSFASSSTLARQVEAGAPADVVALASEDWADYLAERKLIDPASRISPVGNRLVLAAPAGSTATLSDPPTAAEMLAALGPDGRLAVGDPAHVPAGAYARQSLTALGLWDALEPHLALADNVRAALALVEHGEAPLGIVYDTDLRAAPGLRLVRALPDSSHAPITYAFATVTGGNTGKAKAFLDFLSGPDGLAIFASYGFSAR